MHHLVFINHNIRSNICVQRLRSGTHGRCLKMATKISFCPQRSSCVSTSSALAPSAPGSGQLRHGECQDVLSGKSGVTSCDLLHFHYDRHVLGHFQNIGNAASIGLQRALKHFLDSPHDLLLNARALEDLNRQFGPAKFLITLARKFA